MPLSNSLLVAGGLVEFEEDVSSPAISLTRDTREISRSGRMAWANINAAIIECYPAPPLIYGAHPTAAWLYVDSLKFKPWHPDPAQSTIAVSSGVASYDLAAVEVTYSKIPFQPGDVSGGSGTTDLLTRRWSFGGEMMTLPLSRLKWESDNAAVDDETISAGKFIPMVEHSITAHRRTSVNWTAIRKCIGTVNQSTFEGATAGTLLVAGAEITFTFANDGTAIYSVELHFQEKRIKEGANIYGWNHFLRDKDGTTKWDKLLTKDGNKVYSESPNSDLYDLFR